jgi:hypothetical protein
MIDRLGIAGVLGLAVVLGGIGVIAVESPIVASGIGLIIIGTALVVYSLVQNVLGAFGMMAGTGQP